MNYLLELQEILSKKFSKNIPITLETRLLEDLSFDSLDVVELVVEIEDTFGVELNEDHLTRVKTVGDLIKEIQPK
jgi:acyl carrier protein